MKTQDHFYKTKVKSTSRYRKVLKIITDIIYCQLSDQKPLINKTIYYGFLELGGVYIKFLQHLSIKNKFFEGWGERIPRNAFEHVAPNKLNIRAYLNKELGAKAQHFVKIDDKPFAAGSFAQVYRAQHLDGRDLVIKVLRPGLIKNLKQDLLIIKTFSKLVKIFNGDMMLDIGQIFGEFERSTWAETDYEKELKNALWFYNYYQNTPHVVVPKSYPEYSTNSIIVQDYVPGISLAEVINLHIKQGKESAQNYINQQLNSDFDYQLKLIGYELIHGSLFAEIIQGDPHPGNLRLLSNNRIGFLDFGIIAKTPPNKRAYYELLKAYRGFWDDKMDIKYYTTCLLRFIAEDLYFAAETISNNFNLGNGEIDLIEKIGMEAALLLDKHNKTATFQQSQDKRFMSGRIFSAIINEGNRFGIHVKTTSLNLMKSAQIYMSVLTSVDPTSNTMREVLDAIIKVADTKLDMIGEFKTNNYTTSESINIITKWLAEIAQKDPKLFKKLISKM